MAFGCKSFFCSWYTIAVSSIFILLCRQDKKTRSLNRKERVEPTAAWAGKVASFNYLSLALNVPSMAAAAFRQ